MYAAYSLSISFVLGGYLPSSFIYFWAHYCRCNNAKQTLGTHIYEYFLLAFGDRKSKPPSSLGPGFKTSATPTESCSIFNRTFIDPHTLLYCGSTTRIASHFIFRALEIGEPTMHYSQTCNSLLFKGHFY